MNLLIKVLTTPSILAELTESQWDELVRRARYAKLLATIGEWVAKQNIEARIPVSVCELLRGERIRAGFFSLQLRREFSALSMAFADSGYPLVLLKGAAYLALHLPHAKGRRVSDLDLLVPKAYLEDAEQRLSTLGWHQDSALTAYDDHYYRYWMHEVPPLTHAARHIELDLHHTLVPPTSRIRLNDEALFSAVEAVEGYSFSVLSAQDRYLHSAVHLFFSEELRGGLRDLYDLWQMQTTYFSDDQSLISLIDHARELHLQRPLYYALSSAERIFSLPLSLTIKAVLRADAPSPLTAKIMAVLIDAVLLPRLGGDSVIAAAAQWLLFVRSHWLRMPPFMLAKHLIYKAMYRIRIKRVSD